jgi:hypothetical protein
MERDVNLRMKGPRCEIASINGKTLGSQPGFPTSERGYRGTLERVVDIARPGVRDEMARHVLEHIQGERERPPNQTVRKKVRSRVSKAGYPPDEYLNAASICQLESEDVIKLFLT